MRLVSSFIAPWALFTTVLAVPTPDSSDHLVKRDYATVNGVLQQISKDLGVLTSKVTPFDGQVINAVPILDAAAATLKTMNDGKTKIEGQKEVLGLFDTLALLGALGTLDTAVGTVTKELVAKKPQFNQALVGFVVADQLINFQSTAKTLVATIVAKLPAYLPTAIAQIFYQGILTKLDNVVKEFPSVVT